MHRCVAGHMSDVFDGRPERQPCSHIHRNPLTTGERGIIPDIVHDRRPELLTVERLHSDSNRSPCLCSMTEAFAIERRRASVRAEPGLTSRIGGYHCLRHLMTIDRNSSVVLWRRAWRSVADLELFVFPSPPLPAMCAAPDVDPA